MKLFNNQNVVPFHIKNSLEFLKSIKKNVDLIIHVIDCRAINVCEEIDIEAIFGKKKILKIFSKNDLIDDLNKNFCFNFKNHTSRRYIVKLIKDNIPQNIHQKICTQIVVIGIPNSGKSTLINLLKKSKKIKSENTPGTTKGVTKFLLEKNIWIYDTPGIILPKLAKNNNLYKLFAINAIPTNNLDHSIFLEKIYLYLSKYYLFQIEKITQEKTINYQDFLQSIIKKFNIRDRNEISSISRAENKFLNIIHSSKIGKVMWDKSWNF